MPKEKTVRRIHDVHHGSGKDVRETLFSRDP
jgi:hypothetical protein